jgi:PAS domain S-box-containing protein
MRGEPARPSISTPDPQYPFDIAPALDAVPVGITVQDRTGKLVYVNDAGAILLGFPPGLSVEDSTSGRILARFEFVTEEGDPVPLDTLPGRRVLRGEDPPELVIRVRNVETGEESWRVVSATGVRDEHGEVAFAVNTFRDITREKQLQQRLGAQYAVSRILVEAESVRAAGPRILEAICRELWWDAGLLWWLDDRREALRFQDAWHRGTAPLADFVDRSRELTFRRGATLPGRIWERPEADWVRDVREDPDFIRAKEVEEAGLRGACGFAVTRGQDVLGVMEFYSREVRTPDPELMKTLATLGSQIGLLASREEAQEGQRYLLAGGDVLSESIGWEDTLRTVASLVVPRLADTCVVYVKDLETGEITRVAIEDVAGAELAETLPRHRIEPDAEEGVPKVIRTGNPELHPEADVALLAADVEDPDSLQAELEIMPVRSWMCVPLTARGRTFGAVSLVTSVSGRVLDERALAVAQDVARRAAVEVDNASLFRAEQEAQRRLAFLAEASRILSSSLDVDRTLRRLAELAVPQLADWCAVDILEEDGSIRQVAVAHVDPDKVQMARDLRRRYPPDPDAPTGLPAVIRSGKPEMYREITDELLVQSAQDEEQLALARELQLRSVIIVPLTARGRTLGALSMVAAESGRRYGERDLIFAVDLARRAGVAVDNARLYRRSAHVARTLQRSLLPPQLPPIPGVQLAARYRPAGEGIDIGGDFYDLFEAGEGRWAVLLGDVCGKGVEAAAVTGLARHTIRTLVHQGNSAEDALRGLDEEMRQSGLTPASTFCTVAFAELIPGDGWVEATIVCAGHPLPLLLRRDGRVERAGAPGTLIGVLPELHFEPRTVRVQAGEALLLYTDGLVEGLAGDEGAEAVLRGFLADCAGLDAESIADAVDRSLGDRATAARDDSAFVVVRVEPSS